ncbi:hypothetical protein PHAMO_30051 [Magnetospirillum molischianum DSM 120]|uniref:Uncharacterized protein n=1 Tax=Magnetospirillum molischianum DSM 120 TaxID=1150626 RepID=H8FU57_MAGML|nr:hypothetical protein PHAMO_30051 [Magnetospirillum molischianum DSM 120]
MSAGPWRANDSLQKVLILILQEAYLPLPHTPPPVCLPLFGFEHSGVVLSRSEQPPVF